MLGNAEESPLEEILERGARDPILEAISLIGPAGLQRLIGAAPARRRYTGICEACLDINGSADQVRVLRQRLTDTGARFGLDEIGARMWELLAESGNLQTVLARLQDEYDVAPLQLREDLLRLVEQLRAPGLLEILGTGSG